MKSPLVLTLLLAASPVLAADVPWLAEVTTPPAAVPDLDRPLTDLLVNPDGGVIAGRNAWKARRGQLREAWLEFLGPLPQLPAEVKVETVSEERLERIVRSLVRYEAEPGRFVEAFLLRPTGVAGRRPAVVVFHSTTDETIKAVAGSGSKPEQALGLRLAERGFVAICPRNYLWTENGRDQNAVAAAKRRHPNSLGMATMLADGMRAVDLLSRMPEVDLDRIGAIGHSLGAKEVLYLMAFDERVKAGVASEGGVELTSTNWDAPWYLGPACRDSDFSRDHHELLALAAPRPMLIVGGESGPGAADGDRTWPYIAAAQKVYRLYGEPVRLGLLNHRQGHKLSPEVAEKAFVWLEAGLSP